MNISLKYYIRQCPTKNEKMLSMEMQASTWKGPDLGNSWSTKRQKTNKTQDEYHWQLKDIKWD